VASAEAEAASAVEEEASAEETSNPTTSMARENPSTLVSRNLSKNATLMTKDLEEEEASTEEEWTAEEWTEEWDLSNPESSEYRTFKPPKSLPIIIIKTKIKHTHNKHMLYQNKLTTLIIVIIIIILI
jgi:hypothetical protein